MKTLPLSISRTIFRSYQLELKISVKIISAVKEKQFNRLYLQSFEIEGRTYWIMDNETSLRLVYLPKDRKRLMSDTLLISDRELFYVRSAVDELLQRIRSPEIFGLQEDGELVLFSDKNHPITLTEFRNLDHRLQMKPCLIENREGKLIEGATFMINDASNIATLTLREIEALSYHLSKVDLFLYGQVMLNQFATMANRLESMEQQVPAFQATLWGRPEEEVLDREGEMSSTPTPSKTQKRNQVFGLGKPQSTL